MASWVLLSTSKIKVMQQINGRKFRICNQTNSRTYQPAVALHHSAPYNQPGPLVGSSWVSSWNSGHHNKFFYLKHLHCSEKSLACYLGKFWPKFWGIYKHSQSLRLICQQKQQGIPCTTWAGKAPTWNVLPQEKLCSLRFKFFFNTIMFFSK